MHYPIIIVCILHRRLCALASAEWWWCHVIFSCGDYQWISRWMACLQVNRLASIHIDIVFCYMPFMQAEFVYTVQLAIGCVHTPFSFFLMMPHINVSVFLMRI